MANANDPEPMPYRAERHHGEWNIKGPDESWAFTLGFQSDALALRVALALNRAFLAGQLHGALVGAPEEEL